MMTDNFTMEKNYTSVKIFKCLIKNLIKKLIHTYTEDSANNAKFNYSEATNVLYIFNINIILLYLHALDFKINDKIKRKLKRATTYLITFTDIFH